MGGAPQKVRKKGTSRMGGKFARSIVKPPKVPKQQRPPKSFMKKGTQRPERVRATLGSQQDANTKTTLGG
tara:strand:+ start:11205 stop:11414 length:210 start_codon:yes stop_codon:yes gene_type:complete